MSNFEFEAVLAGEEAAAQEVGEDIQGEEEEEEEEEEFEDDDEEISDSFEEDDDLITEPAE